MQKQATSGPENLYGEELKSVEIVFVYGTLKQGFSNHHFLANANFLGNALTCKSYALYCSGLPFVIRDQAVSRIFGEAYSVDGVTLKALDCLEGHPSCYRREQIQICLNEKSLPAKTFLAWIYFYPKPVGRLLPVGIFKG